MSQTDSELFGDLSAEEWKFISERNNLQYQYAEPYMSPHSNPIAESEADLRSRVRDALGKLPRQDRMNLRVETAELRNEIFDTGYCSLPTSEES